MYAPTGPPEQWAASISRWIRDRTPRIPEGTPLGDLYALPNLAASAATPDLRTAMFFDPVLKAMVEDLVFGDHEFDTFAEFRESGFLDVSTAGRASTLRSAGPGDQPYHITGVLTAFMGHPFDELNAHQVSARGRFWPQFVGQLGVLPDPSRLARTAQLCSSCAKAVRSTPECPTFARTGRPDRKLRSTAARRRRQPMTTSSLRGPEINPRQAS